jgi:hypothetical protein
MTSGFSICRVLDDRWIGLFGDKNRNVRTPKTYLGIRTLLRVTTVEVIIYSEVQNQQKV